MTLSEICNKVNLPEKEIKGETRKFPFTMYRQVLMYVISKQTRLTREQIGGMFNRNHSTVTMSIKKVEDLLSIEDKQTVKLVDNCLKLFDAI